MAIQNGHDIDNTFIGKGIVKFQKEAELTYRDLGEVPEFEFTMGTDILPYFTSRTGIRTKARQVLREKTATLRIVMSELTADNLALYLMGAAVAGTPATTFNITIFELSEIVGKLRFIGQNDIGARVQLDFGNVSFTPGASFSPISEEWGQIEVTAECLVDDAGVFGTAIWNITDEVDIGALAAAA